MKKFFLFLNWPLVGIPQAINFLGAFLNQLAFAVNGGAMPVHANFCGMRMNPEDFRHVCMTAATRLKFLCDWIDLGSVILSPGDVLLHFGHLLEVPCFWMWIVLAGIALHRQSVQSRAK